jgi:hypothetical protein
MGNKKGGGIGSKATNAPTTYFTGQPSMRVNPRGVSQIGQSMGNHAMNDAGKVLRGQPEPVRAGAMGGMGSVPLGNQTSLNPTRTVMPCGSQSGLSPAKPMKSQGEIFPGYPGKR